MRCSQCERDIPADAAFCIYCAAPVSKTEASEPRRPATGATIRLDPSRAPVAGPATSRKPDQPATPPVVDYRSLAPSPVRSVVVDRRATPHSPAQFVVVDKRRAGRRKHHGNPGAAVFLIGLALLFLIRPLLWPGILVVIGLSKYARETARGRAHRATGHLFFWIGLAFLFWANVFWPGILILLIGSHLLRRGRLAWRP